MTHVQNFVIGQQLPIKLLKMGVLANYLLMYETCIGPLHYVFTNAYKWFICTVLTHIRGKM